MKDTDASCRSSKSESSDINATKPRLWTGDFTLLLLISLFAFICCQALNNGIPIYVNHQGGATAFAGMLILVFSVSAGIARIIAGRFIDASGRRPIMIFGAVILLSGTIGALVVPGIMPQIVLRVLQGVGFGCITTAASTAAADVLPGERLGEGIGYYGLGQSLGMAVGPALAVFLCGLVYSESLFAGVSVVALVLIVATLLCTYEKHPQRLPKTSAAHIRSQQGFVAPGNEGTATESLLSSLFERRALAGALPMVVVCLAFAIPTSYTSLYAVQCGLENPGLFFVFAAIAMTVVRLGAGSMFDKVRPLVTYGIAIAVGIVSFVLLLVAQHQIPFYAAGACFGISMGLAFPLLNSVTVKNTPSNRWGAANALFYLTNDLGVGFGAVLWGLVADAYGFMPVMLGGALVMAASFGVACLSFPRTKQRNHLAS